MVILVPEKNLEELDAKMKALSPKSLAIIATLDNVRKGNLTAVYYTDDWPEVSAVVCQIISPRISDVADIVCFSTSAEALYHILNETDLITWGRRQMVECVETAHADYLLSHLEPQGTSRMESLGECHPCYLPGPLQGEDRVCPSEFTIGKLASSHAELIATHWNYFSDWPNQIPYFKDLITNYHNVAIYSLDSPDVPVAWNMQYPYGQHAHLYTVKEHRRKGLATVIKRNLCKSVIADGLLPELQITANNKGNNYLISKLGFVKTGLTYKWLVVKP